MSQELNNKFFNTYDNHQISINIDKKLINEILSDIFSKEFSKYNITILSILDKHNKISLYLKLGIKLLWTNKYDILAENIQKTISKLSEIFVDTILFII